jgi:transcriptional regulator with XRE-family HTH domain
MAGIVGMPTRHLHGLKKVRKDRKLSQRQLALLSGVTQVNLSRLENGQPATLPTTKKLARALKVPVKVLLGEEEPEAAEGNGREAIELSDFAGTALMERIEAGEVEELELDEKTFFDQLARYRAKPHNEDILWSVEGYERNLSQGLAALSRRDREDGAEAIRKVLRRLREEGGGAKE